MTKKYRVEFNKRYIKDLEKIPKKERKRIAEKVLSLADNPRPEDCKKLKGHNNPDLYRIRSGNYRIVYTIEDNVLLVLVINVGHRKDIYH